MRSFVAILLAVCSSLAAEPGVPAGQPLPAFKLAGQDGKQHTFRSLRGPKGLMLVFFRSADW